MSFADLYQKATAPEPAAEPDPNSPLNLLVNGVVPVDLAAADRTRVYQYLKENGISLGAAHGGGEIDADKREPWRAPRSKNLGEAIGRAYGTTN